MSILVGNPFLLNTTAATGYQVSRSLRFNSADSAYLSRTFSSTGNRKTWTLSFWLKKTAPGGSDGNGYFSSATSPGSTNPMFVFRDPGDQFDILNNNSGGTTNLRLTTTAVYRDYSAWMHVVLALDTTQATAANRARLYINGTEVTTFSTATYPAQNTDLDANGAIVHNIGREAARSNYYSNYYLANVQFVDGSQLTPSSFAETDATTGQWIPKLYSGSYGTNGFHLEFADNSAATAAALGKDTANSNNWTPNNFSVTAGAGNDSLVDTPTSFGSDTGVGNEVRGNYCTWNPLNKGSNLTISNGNLDVSSATGHATVLTTIPVVAGIKSYMEFTVTTDGGGGWGVTTNPAAENSYGEIAGKWWAYDNGGNFVIINQTSTGNYSPRVNNGDVLQLAIDYSTGKVHLGINNTWINSTNGTDGNPATGANPTFTLSTTAPIFPIFESNGLYAAANFGQRAFAYTAPSGFKALVDTNLPAPVVAKSASAFDIKLYTGNGGTQTVSGLGFSPDLLWFKSRSTGGAGYNNIVFDSVRGSSKSLATDITNGEFTGTDLTSFNSDGFTLAAPNQWYGVNTNGISFVGWAWDAGSSTVTNTQGSITSSVRANASAGFSVVTYTVGNNTSQTIGHGLNVAPQLIIVKERNQVNNWQVYHASLGNGSFLYLNATNASASNNLWNNTSPTSTVFSIRSGGSANFYDGKDQVAYCFAPVAGYSSFGSYTGNGATGWPNADGPFVYLGFRPKFILWKCTSQVENWVIYDSVRETYNFVNDKLLPNSSAAESTNNNHEIDFLSNGFKVRNNNGEFNQSSGTYIYAAFAESPFQYARAR